MGRFSGFGYIKSVLRLLSLCGRSYAYFAQQHCAYEVDYRAKNANGDHSWQFHSGFCFSNARVPPSLICLLSVCIVRGTIRTKKQVNLIQLCYGCACETLTGLVTRAYIYYAQFRMHMRLCACVLLANNDMHFFFFGSNALRCIV